MAEAIDRVKKAGVVGIGAFVASCALLTFGAGTASADDTGPAPTEIGAQGIVSSPQSAAVGAAKRCETNAGTLSTSSVYTPEGNVPKQTTEEKGPAQVGSDAWVVRGVNPANPWRNQFFNPAKTGPQCSFVRAPGATGRGFQ